MVLQCDVGDVVVEGDRREDVVGRLGVALDQLELERREPRGLAQDLGRYRDLAHVVYEGGRAQGGDGRLVPVQPFGDQAGELGDPDLVAGGVGIALGDGRAERRHGVAEGVLQAAPALAQLLFGLDLLGDVERGAEDRLDAAGGVADRHAVGHEVADLAGGGVDDAVVGAIRPAGDRLVEGRLHYVPVVLVADELDLGVAEAVAEQTVDALPLGRHHRRVGGDVPLPASQVGQALAVLQQPHRTLEGFGGRLLRGDVARDGDDRDGPAVAVELGVGARLEERPPAAAGPRQRELDVDRAALRDRSPEGVLEQLGDLCRKADLAEPFAQKIGGAHAQPGLDRRTHVAVTQAQIEATDQLADVLDEAAQAGFALAQPTLEAPPLGHVEGGVDGADDLAGVVGQRRDGDEEVAPATALCTLAWCALPSVSSSVNGQTAGTSPPGCMSFAQWQPMSSAGVRAKARARAPLTALTRWSRSSTKTSSLLSATACAQNVSCVPFIDRLHRPPCPPSA